MSSIEQKDPGSERSKLAQEYRTQIEEELNTVCNEVLVSRARVWGGCGCGAAILHIVAIMMMHMYIVSQNKKNTGKYSAPRA